MSGGKLLSAIKASESVKGVKILLMTQNQNLMTQGINFVNQK